MAIKLGKIEALLTFGLSASLIAVFLLHFEVARMDSNTLGVIIQSPYNATVTYKRTAAQSISTSPFVSVREVKVAKRKPDPPPSTTRRFPVRGTPEFSRQCSWTLPDSNPATPECSILVRPDPLNREGMSLWIDHVVAGYLLAKQARCRILLDYGETVDIHQVLIPFPDMVRNPRDEVNTWTVPSGFKCDSQQDNCYRYEDVMGGNLNTPLFPFPIITFLVLILVALKPTFLRI